MAGDVDHLRAGDTLAHAMTAPANRRSRQMSEQVLVCGCDLQSLRALRLVLRGAGFGVAAADNAVDALDRVAVFLPRGAIVELDLADGDGVELCRRLREWSTMPLIVLSAQDDEEEAVLALEAGADHYVTKPFRPGELVARLRAVLRRVEGADDCARVHVGGLEIDLAARMVFREGERIHLTPIEYRVLRVLTRHRGRVLTHDELRREVWGGAHLSDRRTLRTHMANLRRKIDPAGRLSLIHTLSGAGYLMPQATAEGARAGARAARPVRLHTGPRRAWPDRARAA
jgi:two-component system KDP operon response regulator KdpE